MDSIKKGSGCKSLSEKKAYEPPMAIRLGDMRGGAGQMCDRAGSSDSMACSSPGNSADGCIDPGNSAASGPF